MFLLLRSSHRRGKKSIYNFCHLIFWIPVVAKKYRHSPCRVGRQALKSEKQKISRNDVFRIYFPLFEWVSERAFSRELGSLRKCNQFRPGVHFSIGIIGKYCRSLDCTSYIQIAFSKSIAKARSCSWCGWNKNPSLSSTPLHYAIKLFDKFLDVFKRYQTSYHSYQAAFWSYCQTPSPEKLIPQDG